MWVCILAVVGGVIVCTIGAVKAIKSRFNDLDAITWCFGGTILCMLGMMFSRFL